MNHLIEDFLSQYTFNNIEVLLNQNEELSLDDDMIREKLITKERGGYCFENNQYFFCQLKSMGFKVQRVLGRVIYGGESENVPRTHQITIVSDEEGDYIVDVGFGPYTPGAAIACSGEVVKAFNGNEYRIVKINDCDYQLQIQREGEFISLYEFDKNYYNQADFKLSNYYTSTHPKSKFTTSLILSKLTRDGVCFINNRLFTRIEKGQREDIEIKDLTGFCDIIKSVFKVEYTEDELKSLFDIILLFQP